MSAVEKKLEVALELTKLATTTSNGNWVVQMPEKRAAEISRIFESFQKQLNDGKVIVLENGKVGALDGGL